MNKKWECVMIKVGIVDDHQLIRVGLKALLEDEQRIEVAAEYSSGQQVIDAVQQGVLLDIILLDISMPGLGGMEVLKQLNEFEDSPPVIFITMYSEDAYAVQSIHEGAKGYLTKGCSRDELVEAITVVSNGGIYLNGRGLDLLLHQKDGSERKDTVLSTLSEQEMAVFNYVCRGLTIKEIAYEMGISSKSVSTYKARFMEKLGAKSLAEVIRIGISLGYC
jgi:DNA-binding NarL/FixJ family response regulator